MGFRVWAAALYVLLAACQAVVRPTPTLSPGPTASDPPAQTLTVDILYPKPDTSVEMGRSMSVIARVSNPDGRGSQGLRLVSGSAIPRAS